MGLVPGDAGDPGALAALFRGCVAAFVVTFSDFDGDQETRHGRLVLDAAAAAGVRRVVFSGGMRVGIDFLDVKADLEALLDGALPPSTKAALEKTIADLAAAQDDANGDMPDEKRRRLNGDARAGLSEDHAILMALARQREGQRGS